MSSCFHQNKKRIRILRGHRSLSACFPSGPHHTPCKQHPCSVSWQSGNSSVKGKHTTPPMTHRAGAANASLPHFLKPMPAHLQAALVSLHDFDWSLCVCVCVGGWVVCCLRFYRCPLTNNLSATKKLGRRSKEENELQ